MGFSDRLPIAVSDTQAYKQFGNAVVPPVAEAQDEVPVFVDRLRGDRAQSGVETRAISAACENTESEG